MENRTERILAYGLATPIAQDEMDDISGGGGSQMTTHQTFKVTAHALQSADAAYDVKADW